MSAAIAVAGTDAATVAVAVHVEPPIDERRLIDASIDGSIDGCQWVE